jgi:hypothetical protein
MKSPKKTGSQKFKRKLFYLKKTFKPSRKGHVKIEASPYI